MTNETKRAYSAEVQNKLETYNESEIETEWTNIIPTIIEAAEKTIPSRTCEHTKEWFDKERQHMKEKKNQAKRKWIATGIQQELSNYRKLKQETNKLSKTKKLNWISEQMQELEKNNKDNKKLCQYIKHNTNTNKTTAKINKRDWESYFTEIYNDLAMREGETEEIRSNQIREEEIPTYQEFMEVVKHLKRNKAEKK
ncbi:hypothetical protein QE152_g7978 [Popillia japonica]|uniref:Uncharacterized protein n=1 Tax=Popillia japonica TaxID=7064 RepID=A0AAW1MD70_POPJA